MEQKRIDEIQFSKFYKGVAKNKSHAPKNVKFFAWDTETCQGHVYYSGLTDGEKIQTCYGENKDHLFWILNVLWNKVRGKKNKSYVLFGHYHRYDWGCLLWPLVFSGESKTAPKEVYLSLLYPRCTIRFVFGKPAFGSIQFHTKDSYVSVSLIDTIAFFGMSLEKALEAIGAPVRKKERHPLLGKVVLPEAEIEDYFKSDLLGTWHLGKYIIEQHQKFDVSLCVSLPQMSGKIYRKHYMKAELYEKLPSPVLYASLLSYHGGKNSITVPPGVYYCKELDIRSAYPEAMRQLPSFEKGRFYAWEDSNLKGELPTLHGVYCVSGYVESCKWGCIFSHDFKPLSGEIKEVWVTGYELQEAFDHGHIKKLTRLVGYIWEPDEDAPPSGFVKFVDDMYYQKDNAKTEGERFFYKLILNSLYGKFIARAHNEMEDAVIAGSMFHPFIATLITGFVRAKIHRLEHQYNSLHTATDSIKTTMPFVEKEKGLGSLKLEVEGPCYILRNKLYFHFDQSGKLKKFGLHGIPKPLPGMSPREHAEYILSLLEQGKTMYTVERLVQWAESHHLGINPGSTLFRDTEIVLPEGWQEAINQK